MNSTVKSVIITTDKPSGYNASKKILRINENFSKGHMIHESGHVIADYFKVYEDSEFVEVLRSGLEEFTPERELIVDTMTFDVPVRRVSNKKFISEYQGRVYDNTSLFANNGINPQAMREYFSEGYREYFEDSENLKANDLKLFNFIRKLVE